MKVVDNFNLSTKKFSFFYEFEKMWIVLTAINVVAIFLIVRGSTAPLLIDNAVMRFLFCTDTNGDKTLYSIGISYFAAYIFYLIQIYYPERKKTINTLLHTRSDVRSMIMWLYRFLYVWDIYKHEDSDEESGIKGAHIETVYLKDNTGFVYKVDRDSFKTIVERISESYHDVINNPYFQYCDYALRRVILGQNIAEFIKDKYKVILQAEALNDSGSILIRYSKAAFCGLKRKMQYLEKLYDISVSSDYIITNDKEDIDRIEKRDQMLAEAIIENSAFCEVLATQNGRVYDKKAANNMAYKNLIDWEKYLAEEQEIETLTDPIEADEREKLLEEINEKVLDYNAHINAYNYAQHCKSIEARGLIFKPISKRTATRKWDAFFASSISQEEKRKIYYNNFKWHMFSYEKIEALKGDEATCAFDCCEKESAYVFIQCTDEAWRIENAQLLTSADLGVDYSFERADVYIFDVNGKWAYARTHESDCGPYFLRID